MFPDKVALDEWVLGQKTPILRQVARTIINHTECVSEEMYFAQVRMMVADFSQKINRQSYVILLAENEPHREGHDVWLSEQILPLFTQAGVHPPKVVVGPSGISEYLRAHKKVKHVLLLDNAAFNATQQIRVLQAFKDNVSRTDFTLYIGIPYLAEAAETFFLKQSIFPKNDVLIHGKLQSLMPCLSETDRKYIQRLKLPAFKDAFILSYFWDYVPDCMFHPILKGGNLLSGFTAELMLEDFFKRQGWDLEPHFSLENEEGFDTFVLEMRGQETAGMFLSDLSFWTEETKSEEEAVVVQNQVTLPDESHLNHSNNLAETESPGRCSIM
ncbi:MAG: hypothetical protein K0U37_09015 [Gammaproteobacteria bacterium]|nr:hypothetical protein [Gammaproteobacteria bacterium]